MDTQSVLFDPEPKVIGPPMDAAEARDCVQRINGCMGDARRMLLELYEREGWRALGYGSWRACVVAEFQQSQARLYQQLEAARIEREISTKVEIGTIPERHLRPLSALDEPADQRAAWEIAQHNAGSPEQVTGAIVKQAVDGLKGDRFVASNRPTAADRTQFIPLPSLEFAGVTPLRAHLANPPKPKFNRTNDNVEWALWTWNPVTGCLHDCDYCYARDIANRFYPQGFTPTLHPDRLGAPQFMAVPDPETVSRQFEEKTCSGGIGEKNVFVCSMADLFGKWVPRDWIDKILDQVVSVPEWNFLFLTKFPQRLCEFEWPANAWVGTTVDRQYRVDIAEKAFRKVTAGVKWLSCEPMLEPLAFTSLEMFDWIVVGGSSKSSQTPEFFPPPDWVFSLYEDARASGCRWYEKKNLWRPRIREYPGD